MWLLLLISFVLTTCLLIVLAVSGLANPDKKEKREKSKSLKNISSIITDAHLENRNPPMPAGTSTTNTTK